MTHLSINLKTNISEFGPWLPSKSYNNECCWRWQRELHCIKSV